MLEERTTFLSISVGISSELINFKYIYNKITIN